MLKVATVCTGIGSPEKALVNLGIEHDIAFACEIDKYARQTYMANFNPAFMVPDMTKETWEGDKYYADLFIGGIPCQAFSLAGKRLGELDPRGLLFYDFYRYVQVQQPKYFIIENVKGLLSDDNGKTFRNWIQLLGRSENTHVNIFNHPDSLEYNLHWKVLNSKDFGVPQNRERVFLVGIRKDLSNTFRFPIGWRLDKRLKDILEPEVDERYYLSEKAFNYITAPMRIKKGFTQIDSDLACTLTAKGNTNWTGDFISVKEPICAAMSGCSPETASHNMFVVKEATKQGYAIAKEGDSINLSNPNSETRRGRVGNQIANTLDTACNQAVVVEPVQIGKSKQFAETSKLIGNVDQEAFTIRCTESNGIRENKHRIRRLTPLECFRLQGFPDSYIKPCSDSQTYKQAGNSITVNVMQAILKNLLT